MQIARTYRELWTYQVAREGAKQMFKVSKRFSLKERYSLTNQIRCSSRAVKAEGGLHYAQ